jgi:hypothetical protein
MFRGAAEPMRAFTLLGKSAHSSFIIGLHHPIHLFLPSIASYHPMLSSGSAEK